MFHQIWHSVIADIPPWPWPAFPPPLEVYLAPPDRASACAVGARALRRGQHQHRGKPVDDAAMVSAVVVVEKVSVKMKAACAWRELPWETRQADLDQVLAGAPQTVLMVLPC